MGLTEALITSVHSRINKETWTAPWFDIFAAEHIRTVRWTLDPDPDQLVEARTLHRIVDYL